MKIPYRYLVCVIPALGGGLISAVAAWKKTMPMDELENPYHNPELLDGLSSVWLIIGVCLSVAVFLIMLINDIFSFIGDRLERARIEKKIKE